MHLKKNMIAIRIIYLTWVSSPPRIPYHLPTCLRTCQTNVRYTECDRDAPTPCRRSLAPWFFVGMAFLTSGELRYSSPWLVTRACWSTLRGECHRNLQRKCWIPWTSSRLAGTYRRDGTNSHLRSDGEPIPWQGKQTSCETETYIQTDRYIYDVCVALMQIKKPLPVSVQ